ncbi:MAG: 4-hydroxyphenylpyruvate dioxygenase [Chloroflexi bacterium]|nr:4-hydroxyphenylpyruvate dioxygenase [Chloroflexota bacterium]
MEREDVLPIQGIDYLEYYVGNAKQAAYFYRKGFGFQMTAYAGPETGVRDRASYVLEQGEVRLVFTTPLRPEHPIMEHIRRHGDGVRDIALRVEDAAAAYHVAIARGARSVQEPTVSEDEGGIIKQAAIATYGDTIHTFIERRDYLGAFAPGYEPLSIPEEPVGLLQIDHVVGNVDLGAMNRWVDFYRDVLGFSLFVSFDDKDISTEYSALMSKVMADGGGRIKFPINEPAPGRRKSQIDEYLEFYQGPGVQHVALLTDDIIATVGALQERGIEFLTVPPSYYEGLPARVGEIAEPIAALQRLGILVDRDEEGYLLQIFTKPVEDRPTLFYEIIQRKGARSFGKGNFKALFEAIEREQARRGNL